MRFIIEVAPTSANTAMLSMTSPSARFDPTALACYTNCVLQLPPGVPSAMNEKGDFWRMVLKTARAVAPAITPVVSSIGPQAALAMQLANTTLKNTEKARKAQKEKAKVKVPPPKYIPPAKGTVPGSASFRKN